MFFSIPVLKYIEIILLFPSVLSLLILNSKSKEPNQEHEFDSYLVDMPVGLLHMTETLGKMFTLSIIFIEVKNCLKNAK